MIVHELTKEELAEAVAEGDKRQANNEEAGRADRYGATGGARYHRLGAAGELAFCKAMGLEWTGKQHIRAPDAEDWEVRTTFMLKDGHLIVHPDDHDDRRYALVHPMHGHERLTYCIVGWKLGRDCKNPDWWRTTVREPAYFVPQSVLLQL